MSADRHVPIESIHALVAGGLDPSDAAGVRTHLDRCGECAELREDADALDRALRELPRLDCPTDLRASLREIPSRAIVRKFPIWSVVGTLCGLAAAAALGAFLLHRGVHAPQAGLAPRSGAVASAREVAVAERQLKAALVLIKATGEATATRATEKVLAEGVASPARRVGLALLAASRRATKPETTRSPSAVPRL